MQNLKENKINIYLSGGGNERQSFPLDNFFFNTLPKNGRFLYVPAALRGHKSYPIANSWIRGVLDLHKRFDIELTVLDNLTEKQLEYLKSFDAIYIGGGNTWNLIKEMKESGFGEALVKYVELGGKVYGGSAGAIILGKRIDAQDDENIVKWTDNYGFSLLKDYSVTCHFKDGSGQRFKTWAQTNNLPLLCLSEETGLIIENTIVRCVDSKPCVIYTAQGERLDVHPQEVFSLK